MNKRFKPGRLFASIAIMAVAVASLTACFSPTLSTPTGMCGWIVGNGQGDNDAKIKSTVWPDQKVTYDETEETTRFVPCGPRNYITVDGGETGDWQTPYEALTSDGTPVKVTLDALWQLNQTETVLAMFAELCNKYACYTTDTSVGGSNFATDGWNGMLRENFRPAIENAIKQAMPKFSDDIWQKQDPAVVDEFEVAVSAAFMETIRARTGYNADLFCGSGNSGWSDPENAGADGNEFTCTQVRFDSASVKAANAGVQANASATTQVELDTAANEARYTKSFPLYGDQTHYWLGVQDSVAKCPSGSTCNIYLGNVPTSGQ